MTLPDDHVLLALPRNGDPVLRLRHMIHELLDERPRLLQWHIFNVMHIGSDVQVLDDLLLQTDYRYASHTYRSAAPLVLLDQFVPAEGKLHRVCVFEVLRHCRLPAVKEGMVCYEALEPLLHIFGQLVICGAAVGELTVRQQRSAEVVRVAPHFSSTTHA